jgi:hypothetical protein
MFSSLYAPEQTPQHSVITIIISRQELGLDRPVSTSSNSLFKDLPSRLRPFGL